MHTAVFPFSGGGIASESSRASAWQPVGKAVLCVIFQDGEEAAVASASVYFLASGECSALGRMPDPAAWKAQFLPTTPWSDGEITLSPSSKCTLSQGSQRRMCTCDVATETEQDLCEERGNAQAALSNRKADSFRFCYKMAFIKWLLNVRNSSKNGKRALQMWGLVLSDSGRPLGAQRCCFRDI